MKFSTRQDVSAPPEKAFQAFANFRHFERFARMRGVDVSRIDDLESPGTGMGWHGHVQLRGRAREFNSELTLYTPSEAFEVTSRSAGMTITFSVQVIALSPRRSRLQIQADLRPQSVSARLFLQSLRLRKSRLSNRFARAVKKFAARIPAA